MLARLALLFIGTTMVELTLLLLIAQHTSALFTIGLIILTGFLGAWLAQHEGTQCLSRIQHEMSQGQMPGDALLDGLMILIAGAVLLTPGVLTDLLGFGLLIPPIRTHLKKLVVARFRDRIVVAGFPSPDTQGTDRDDVIDVEHRPTGRPGDE